MTENRSHGHAKTVHMLGRTLCAKFPEMRRKWQPGLGKHGEAEHNKAEKPYIPPSEVVPAICA